MQPKRTIDKRLLLLAGVVVVMLLGFGIAALTGGDKGEEATTDVTNQDGKYDPNSKEVISDPKGKTPEVFGTNADAPAYYGLEELLDQGVTMTQVDDFKYGFYQYFVTNKKRTEEASIVVSTIKTAPVDPSADNERATIFFDVVVDNDTTYKIKMDYFDLESVQIYISNTAGKQIYDSGIVTNQSV